MPSQQQSHLNTHPKPEHVLEAVRFLQEGLTIPDVYFRAILDLVEGEYVRRARSRAQAA